MQIKTNLEYFYSVACYQVIGQIILVVIGLTYL